MRKLLLFAIFCNTMAFAQVGIGTLTPHASAMLDVNSTTKGLLVPRVTSYPSSPATGLLVYRTDLNAFYAWNGISWTQAVFGSSGPTGSGWALTGNSGTAPGTHYIGTSDNNDLMFKVNNTTAGYLGQTGSSEAVTFGVTSSAGYRSTAIGYNAISGSNAAVALGYKSRAANQDAVAVGNNAVTGGNEAIAIGTNTNAGNYRAIAIGSAAKAYSGSNANDAIAIGYNANASSYQGIAIGANAYTGTNGSALAVGLNANATGYQSAAFGNSASATAQNATAIGNGAVASQANTVILGNSANVGIGTSAPTSKIQVVGIPAYSSDVAAGNAGLTKGAFYQTNGGGTGIFANVGVLMVKQ